MSIFSRGKKTCRLVSSAVSAITLCSCSSQVAQCAHECEWAGQLAPKVFFFQMVPSGGENSKNETSLRALEKGEFIIIANYDTNVNYFSRERLEQISDCSSLKGTLSDDVLLAELRRISRNWDSSNNRCFLGNISMIIYLLENLPKKNDKLEPIIGKLKAYVGSEVKNLKTNDGDGRQNIDQSKLALNELVRAMRNVGAKPREAREIYNGICKCKGSIPEIMEEIGKIRRKNVDLYEEVRSLFYNDLEFLMKYRKEEKVKAKQDDSPMVKNVIDIYNEIFGTCHSIGEVIKELYGFKGYDIYNMLELLLYNDLKNAWDLKG